jgi:thiol-disulfide isomerase/thioredoxin
MRKAFAISLIAIFVIAAGAASTKAPDFTGGVWIDSDQAGAKVPHSIKGYRGQVLLVDFWEYTCINCIRDFSVLKRWYGKYHAYGLDIVGMHFGEFPMGYKTENVRQAAKRFRLPWPVVADLQGDIWKAYNSDVWPNRYLIDQNGDIVMHLEGEGNNGPMEKKIRELLAPTHPEVSKLALDPDENTFTPQCGITTDETYVGDWFGRGAVEDQTGYQNGQEINFHAKGEPKDGGVMLEGRWVTAKDGVTSASKQSSVVLRYHARSVYAVLSVDNPKKPVRFYLLQDGKPLSKDEAAADVQFDAQGSYVEVSESRLYYLLKNAAFGSHLLTLEPQGKNFSLHSFTYGNDCQQDVAPI